jgi:hypothetical protein
MPYDPASGQWTDEDTNVETRMNNLLSKDNEYMQQARTEGLNQSNRRGLLNSTMGVTAVEDSRIRAALPIASQDASQAHSREQLGRQLQSTDVTQRRGLASDEALTREGYGLQRELQAGDIASRERMQGVDNTVRQNMQALDLEFQDRIARLEVGAEQRGRAGALAASFEQGYNSMLETIMNNPDIPADARQTYMDHAARIRESNVALIEQLYGIDLQWETA